MMESSNLAHLNVIGDSNLVMASHFLRMSSGYVLMASTCLAAARSQQLQYGDEQRKQHCYDLAVMNQGIFGGWGNLPAHLFDRMKALIDQDTPDASVGLLKSARLVNRHWSNWATDATTFLMPTRRVPLEVSMAAITSRFRNVDGLRLACHLRVTDESLRSLANIPRLKHLDLRGCGRLTDASLKCLQPLKHLTHLSLKHCNQITNKGVMHLSKLTKLTDLDLSWCDKVTLVGVRFLAPLTNLTFLNLKGCSVVSTGGIVHAYQRCLSYLKTLACQIEF